MRLIMNRRADLEEPEVTLAYREMTEGVKRVSDFVKSLDRTILCKKENEEYEVAVSDIFYIESVDKKSFVYCEKEVFQCSYRLYELEELLPSYFMRVSKSGILNTRQIFSIDKNLYASSTVCFRRSHKQVFVSRHYYKPLIEKLESKRTLT